MFCKKCGSLMHVVDGKYSCSCCGAEELVTTSERITTSMNICPKCGSNHVVDDVERPIYLGYVSDYNYKRCTTCNNKWYV